MRAIPCSNYTYRVIHNSGCLQKIYSYIRNEEGDKDMSCLTPLHGRSFVVGKTENGRYIVSKGNGLSYTQYPFLHTGEFCDGTWGLLLRQDAERDFLLGQEIEALGIKTNHMQYVIEVDLEIDLPNGHKLKPTLLQYDVECPYRICDAPFMDQKIIQSEIQKWESINERGYEKYHLIAANILIRNLRILHDNNILHNAIEATEKLDDPDERFIYLSVKKVNNLVHIFIENSFKKDEKITFNEDGLPISIKKDNRIHGYGMKSIKLITETYSGNLNINVENNKFRLDLIFTDNE